MNRSLVSDGKASQLIEIQGLWKGLRPRSRRYRMNLTGGSSFSTAVARDSALSCLRLIRKRTAGFTANKSYPESILILNDERS